jgi:hypothetical protein
MQANLTAIMDGIATLVTNSALVSNVYAYPVSAVTVPCAVVGYPTDIQFDLTFGRGGDEMTLPVWFIVGIGTTKDARDALSTILGDTSSIKSTLDGAQSFGDVRVTDAKVTTVTIAAVEYLAAEFTVEVI